jgi:oxidase EvaA
MDEVEIYDISKLRMESDRFSWLSNVSLSKHFGPDWTVDQQKIFNIKSDYFSIGLFQSFSSVPQFLIEQMQPALVLLLITEIEGKECAILNCRFEPGLIGKVNFTSTIQSTPNNYSRSHGGKATTFIEILKDPKVYGEILYNNFHYDWGDYYVSKKKQFLIVRLNKSPKLDFGFCFFPLNELKKLSLEDHLITNDLRACISLIFCAYKNSKNFQNTQPNLTHTKLTNLKSLPLSLELTDSKGNQVSFFKVTSQTREVKSWLQPLLKVRAPKKISLVFKEIQGQKFYAVEQASQIGLLGEKLWFPAEINSNFNIYRKVCTCGEGGRFWHYLIHIEIYKVNENELNAGHIFWLPEGDLIRIILNPLTSSLELRLALSISLF